MMAYYPVNETDVVNEWNAGAFVNRNNKNLTVANAAVKDLARQFGYQYIDVNTGLTDERGMLRKNSPLTVSICTQTVTGSYWRI